MFMRYWFLKEFQIYGVYIVYLNSLRVLALYYTKDLPTRPNREVHTVRLQVAPGASTELTAPVLELASWWNSLLSRNKQNLPRGCGCKICLFPMVRKRC